MRTRFTLTICALTLLASGAGYAQSGVEGRSCGGLLCDMGVFGHKTTPPPPIPTPVAAPAPPPPEAKAVASREPAPKPKVRVAHRKAPPKVKNVAKAAASTPPSAPVAAAAAPVAAPPSTPSRNAPLLFQTVDPRL